MTTDGDILSNFNVSKDLATADLYAFRFTDSALVILECTVHICSDRTCDVSHCVNSTILVLINTRAVPEVRGLYS